MPIDTTIIAADRDAIVADLPTSVVIGATTYSCRKTRMTRKKEHEVFGENSGYDFTIHLNASEIAVAPDDTVTIASVTYRVIDTDAGECGVGLAIHLGGQFA